MTSEKFNINKPFSKKYLENAHLKMAIKNWNVTILCNVVLVFVITSYTDRMFDFVANALVIADLSLLIMTYIELYRGRRLSNKDKQALSLMMIRNNDIKEYVKKTRDDKRGVYLVEYKILSKFYRDN